MDQLDWNLASICHSNECPGSNASASSTSSASTGWRARQIGGIDSRVNPVRLYEYPVVRIVVVPDCSVQVLVLYYVPILIVKIGIECFWSFIICHLRERVQ